jgi:hypothetical protein
LFKNIVHREGNLKIYKVETGITDWFIAENFSQLLEIIKKHYGDTYLDDEFDEGVQISRLSPGEHIEICHNDDDPTKTGSKSVEKWLQLYENKPGMLCSTEY